MKFKIKRLIQVEQIIDIPVNDIKDDTHLKGRIAVEQENLLHKSLRGIKTESAPLSNLTNTIQAHGIEDSHLKTELVEL